MPSPAETFSQIGQQPQQQGPFNQYLQPRPIDALPQPGTQATGFEKPAVGIGEVALGFLQGIRKSRVAQTAEQEANNETSLNNYRQQVNAQLQDPDLTPSARQAILAKANDVLNQHMHYELRDAPKDGVGGFFKNLLVQASGGPIKTREPIDFEKEQGALVNLAKGTGPDGLSYSQNANFNKASQMGQAAVDKLKQGDPANGIAPVPNPNSAQVDAVLQSSGAFKLVTQGAPEKVNDFLASFGVQMGARYPAQGSYQDLMNSGAGLFATQAPPPGPGEAAQAPATQTAATAAPPQVPIRMGLGTVNVPGIQVTQPPPQAPVAATPAAVNVHPADTWVSPQAAGPAVPGTRPPYEEGITPQQFSYISSLANSRDPNNRIDIRPAETMYSQDNGARFDGVTITGAPWPQANGVWDAQTGMKVKGVATKASSYDLGVQGVRDPVSGKVIFVPKSQAAGMESAGQSMLDQRIQASKESQARSIKATDARAALNRAAAGDARSASLANRRLSQREAIETKFDAMEAVARRGQLSEITSQSSALGIPVSKASLVQAATNAQPLIDEIEDQRNARLNEFDAATPAAVGVTTAPPTPPKKTDKPPAAPVKPAAAAGAGDADAGTGFYDLPDK